MSHRDLTLKAVLLAIFVGACGTEARLTTGGQADADASPPVDTTSVPDAVSEHPGTAHDGAADAARAPIAPPPDICAPLHLEYADAGAAGALGCPFVTCTCAGVTIPIQVPGLASACVRSFDCTAACATGTTALTCTQTRCSSDSDCSVIAGIASHCVTWPGWTQGLCDSGCVDASDCFDGYHSYHCVATQNDGTRSCVEPANNDHGPCNQDADCRAGRCAFQGTSFVGVCTDGAVSSLCFSDTDCASGLHCRNVAGGKPGLCSDGAEKAPCDRDNDCQVGVCVLSTCNAGKVGDYCRTNADCQAGACSVDMIVCADVDVDSGSCRHEPGVDPYTHFGTCD